MNISTSTIGVPGDAELAYLTWRRVGRTRDVGHVMETVAPRSRDSGCRGPAVAARRRTLLAARTYGERERDDAEDHGGDTDQRDERQHSRRRGQAIRRMPNYAVAAALSPSSHSRRSSRRRRTAAMTSSTPR
jgi:hypothetical protein